MVVPEENWAYRTVAGGGTTTSPALAQRFPHLGTVGEVMRACLKDPAAQFDLAAPQMLLDNVVRNLPAERRNGPVTGANATARVTADVKVSEIAAAELTHLDQLGLLHPSGIPPGHRFHLDPCEPVAVVQRRIRRRPAASPPQSDWTARKSSTRACLHSGPAHGPHIFSGHQPRGLRPSVDR